jgi:hypothetical protein
MIENNNYSIINVKCINSVTLGMGNDIFENMVKTLVRILVGLAAVDQILLAEGAALAVTAAMICAVSDDLESISSTFYKQFLCSKIPKTQKIHSSHQSFLCFCDLCT